MNKAIICHWVSKHMTGYWWRLSGLNLETCPPRSAISGRWCPINEGYNARKIPKGGNQNPYIEEQTTQWPKEKVQKDKQRPTKHTHRTKDRVTRTPLKTWDELYCSGRVSSYLLVCFFNAFNKIPKIFLLESLMVYNGLLFIPLFNSLS
jgi:hypothetical protein